jgi:riboflavin biosynthesis pyrimidine reductase
VTSLLDAGLLDELKLIVHPILVGSGDGIAGALRRQQRLEFVAAEPGAAGLVTVTYRLRNAG